MTQKLETSVIEAGNSTVKMITPATKGKPIVIPSLVYADSGAMIGGNVLQNGSKPPSIDTINVAVGDTRYLVGNAAYNATIEPWRVMGRDKFTKNTFKALVLGSISEGKMKGDIRLIMGLPVSWYRPQYIDALNLLVGSHTIDRKEQRNRRVNIVEVIAKPETLGTIYSRMLSANGELIKPKFTTARVYAADIGEYTTDLLAMEKFSNIESHCDSRDYGCRNFYHELIKAIEREYDKRVDMVELRSIIDTGKLKNPKTGKTVDVAKLISDIKTIVVESLISMFTTVWGDVQAADVIIITGGGAVLFGDQLKARYGARVIVVENPQLANAVGFWRYSIYKGWN